ncbi:hypothetical protein MAR_031644 [Mya arenaria]|uniref:Uncharacterized protein n=1 Tax=Mya arenaria TaxID=6604 RepID=A0ABY7F5F1_MYAAR|nr:hypothetical protein MAR_031644 [Mya arenaria]
MTMDFDKPPAFAITSCATLNDIKDEYARRLMLRNGESKQVLDNLYDAISRSKIKRSDEKSVEMHTIIASVSGENISQSKAKTNLAKRLGVSVRRISGVQRGKVLTSDKSCWFYTKKKTRSDKISDENKKLIYEFWMSPGISRPTGNKQDVKRHRTGPKCYLSHPIHILEKTQTDVYEEFLQTHPSCTISQRAFEKLKPFFVKPVRPKDKTKCCCRYHIEFNHAFKKCMQFRKMTYTNSEQLNGGYPVFERSADMIARTLCEQPGKACLDRKCVECGVPQYLFSPNEMDESEQAPEIEWERYEYQTVKSKSNVLNRKLILVKKTTKVGSLFKHILELLKSYPRHQFNSEWQNKQAKFIMEHIPEGDVIAIHDFSENYRCTTQKEIQSTYFQKTEVTIHVTILHRHHVQDGKLDLDRKIQEQFFVISPDLKHDHHFTYYVQQSVIEYLKSINYPLKTVHEFTDGCASQYKSRHCFGSLNVVTKDLVNYYETAHAKGPQDAAGGLLKQTADMAVLRGQVVIQSAEDFYNFACNTLQIPSSNAKCSKRIFKFVEEIPRNTVKYFQPVSRVRTIHQIILTCGTQMTVRDLSCYCDECITGNYSQCENRNNVGQIDNIKLTIQRNTANIETEYNGYEHTPIYDLVSSGDVIAVKAVDTDYYLLRVAQAMYTLLSTETDDFRTT